jgi:hypothetical protein
VPPDGSIEIKGQSYDAWRLAATLSALNRRNGHAGHHANLERAAAVVAALDGFRRLEAELDVGARRKIVGEIGPCIGALDRAIEASAQDGLEMPSQATAGASSVRFSLRAIANVAKRRIRPRRPTTAPLSGLRLGSPQILRFLNRRT